MEAKISNFRQGRHHTYPNQMIIISKDSKTKEDAAKLVGKKVTYKTETGEIAGKIASSHGNKGAVRAIFEKGMPGQSIGKSVSVQ